MVWDRIRLVFARVKDRRCFFYTRVIRIEDRWCIFYTRIVLIEDRRCFFYTRLNCIEYDDHDIIYEEGPYNIGNGYTLVQKGERGHREENYEWIHVYGNFTNNFNVLEERIIKEPINEIRYQDTPYFLFILESQMIDADTGLKLSTPTFYDYKNEYNPQNNPEELETQIHEYTRTNDFGKLMGGKFGLLFTEFLQQFNKENKTDYIIDSVDFSSRIDEARGSGYGNRDGMYYSVSNFPSIVYVKNKSENKIHPSIPKNIPNSLIYSENEEVPSYRDIKVMYKDEIIFDELYMSESLEYQTTSTIDTAIKYAMDKLEEFNPSKFFYENVKVTRDLDYLTLSEYGIETGFLDGLFINLVINVGKYADILTEEKRLEDIMFETEYVYDEELLLGSEEIIQEGFIGVRQLDERVAVYNGETIREVISSEILKSPVNKIIKIGMKDIRDEVVNSEIDYETIYVKNSELLIGTEEVSQEGVVGLRSITTQVIFINDVELSREVISNEVILNPVNRIVQIGTKAAVIEDISKSVVEETRTEEIPFEVIYEDNPELEVGTEKISQEGVNGVRTIVESVTAVGGTETNREVISEEVTLAPVNQVVQVGTKDVFEETKIEEVAFEVERVDNPELLVGTEEVSQEGVAGVRTIVEEVTTVEGEETDRVVLSSEVTTEPVNQIIQVGTKALVIEDNATVVSEETRTEEVPFEVVYEDNPELEVGTEEISQEGVNGVRTIVESVTTVGSVETNREVVSDEVTTEPVHQVVQVGTQVADAEDGETPVAPGDGAGTGSDENGSGVVPAPPADSGVSESDDSSQQEILPETGTALTNAFASLAGLLLAMGASFIFFTRRRNAVK